MRDVECILRSRLRAAIGPIVLVTAALANAANALGQTPKQPARIGTVTPVADEASARKLPIIQSFQAGLAEQGLVEGRDFVFERRYTDGHPERFEAMTQELVNAKVDLLLVGVCGTPLDAARRATQTIPIVVPTCNDDLVELGIVKSFSHPGGNITGQSKLTPELAPKRLQLLLQVVPKAKRIAVLWNPAYSEFKADWRELRVAAHALGVTLAPFEFRRADDLEPAFDAIARERPDALMMFSDQLAFVLASRVAHLAAERHLATIFAFREVPDAGGLMSYGPSILDMWHQSAKQVARILRGEKAGDLPIEQPTRFELVINSRVAGELGVKVPRSLLLQADAIVH